MLQRKVDAGASRIPWRTTIADPVPVDIDLTDLKFEDLSDRGWLESSYELRHGLRVREVAMDKLPDDLIRAFAKLRH